MKKSKVKDVKIVVEEPRKVIKGVLEGDKVIIIEDFENAQEYYDKGAFGEIHGVKKKRLELALVEAMYLLERDKLRIFSTSGRELTFEQLIKQHITRGGMLILTSHHEIDLSGLSVNHFNLSH